MDLTTAAFGPLVTVIGALLTTLVLLVRRELDHNRQALSGIDQGLRRREDDHQFLQGLIEVFKHKAKEHAGRMQDAPGA